MPGQNSYSHFKQQINPDQNVLFLSEIPCLFHGKAKIQNVSYGLKELREFYKPLDDLLYT